MGSGKPGASALLWSRLLPTAERWMAELDGACVNRLGEERLKARVLIGDQANATVLKQWVARTGGGFESGGFSGTTGGALGGGGGGIGIGGSAASLTCIGISKTFDSSCSRPSTTRICSRARRCSAAIGSSAAAIWSRCTSCRQKSSEKSLGGWHRIGGTH